MAMSTVVVSGGFDDLRSRDVRFLHEASRLGDVHVLLWSDELVHERTGKAPKFPEAERRYVLDAIRFVSQVIPVADPVEPDSMPGIEGLEPTVWVVPEEEGSPGKWAACQMHGLGYRVLRAEDLAGFPPIDEPTPTGRKKVIVTGCYDWFHSGHVRFFEEAAEHGELYVVVGHDANLRLLKGEGHPLFHEQERRYLVESIRFVHRALISTGHGWMDAEPEIERIRPDAYLVNEDGDRPEKRAFCASHGLEYIVLKRVPKAGLPRRQSTDLRGF
jgi:cytidyltransferase-like protein